MSTVQTSIQFSDHSQQRSVQVRFDNECVVIPSSPPPSQRLPRLVKKSYSVPVWRRRPSQSNEAVSDSEVINQEEGSRVVFKVPVYSISIKARSLSSSEPARRPLQPCMVHREPGSPESPRILQRDPLSPPSPQLKPSRDGVEIVPLRPCCVGCISSAEQCILKGVAWKEKFTPGARRRRDSASNNSSRASYRNRLHDFMPGFETVVSVDEVAKKQSKRGSGVVPEEPSSDVEAEHADISLRRKNLNMDSSDLLATLALSESAPSVPVKEDKSLLFPLPCRGSPVDVPNSNFQPLVVPPSAVESHSEDLEGLARSDESSSSSITPSSPETMLYGAGAPRSTRPTVSQSRVPLDEPYSADDNSRVASSPAGGSGRSPSSRRRSFVHLPAPGSFFKASTEMFRGVGAGVFGGGVPMSV